MLIEVMVRVRVLMTMRVLSSAGLWDGHLRFIYFKDLFIYIYYFFFLAARGLLGCMQPSPVAASRGYSVAVLGLLMVVASLLEHRL